MFVQKYNFLDYVRSFFLLSVMYLFVGLSIIFLLPINLCNRELSYVLFRYHCTRIVLGIFRLFGLDYEYMGSVPNFQCLIASNHMHHFDTIFLPALSKSPMTTFFVKKSLGMLPYFKDFILLNRNGFDRDFLERAKEEVAKGKSIGVFPEGTRVPPDEYKEYSKSVAFCARYLKLDVVPTSSNIGYVFDPKRWYGLGLCRFDKKVYYKIHPIMRYNEVIFKHYYNELKHSKFEKLDSINLANLKTILEFMCHDDEGTMPFRFRLISKLHRIISDLDGSAEYISSPDISIDELEDLIDVSNLPASFKDVTKVHLMHDIQYGLHVLHEMKKVSNAAKDMVFTDKLEKTIRRGVHDIINNKIK